MGHNKRHRIKMDIIEKIEKDMKLAKMSFNAMNNFWSYTFDMSPSDMLWAWENKSASMDT